MLTPPELRRIRDGKKLCTITGQRSHAALFNICHMIQRNESLDALRGVAILAMILSGSIAFGGALPAWMYHAQVPPPSHRFNPNIPGITWVDLVFPFFLFSMGAAIPIALKKHLDAGKKGWYVVRYAVKRFILLTFFALFIQHMKAWVISPLPDTKAYLLSLLAFVLLFFSFYANHGQTYQRFFTLARFVGLLISCLLLWKLPFAGGKGFDFYRSDIIILVLANMAFFGTLLWYVTQNRPWWRLGVLPFIMAIFLSAKEPGAGWAQSVFHWKSIGAWQFDWLYRFYFLKYLFIILPGTFAGEWMLRYGTIENTTPWPQPKWLSPGLALIAILLLCINLYGLYARVLTFIFLATLTLCSIAWHWLQRYGVSPLNINFVAAGSYLLLLGLCFESYEGGIKKDPSTYSYYFVTAGLAFFMLLFFSIVSANKFLGRLVRYFARHGQNPMVAYVAGNLLLLPLLHLTHTQVLLDKLSVPGWPGFVRGVVFTGMVSAITLYFVKKKWYWKT